LPTKASEEIVITNDYLDARLKEYASKADDDNKMQIESEDPNSSASIIKFNPANMEMSYSEFLNPEQKRQNDVIGDLMKDHNKLNGIMNNRLNSLKPVHHWFSTGNEKSALNAINMMSITEPTLVLDLLNMSFAAHRGLEVIPETGTTLLQKASMLLDSKIEIHRQKAIEFVIKIFKTFQNDIVSLKCAPMMGEVDIEREHRLKKYDKLIDELNNVCNKESLKKQAESKKANAKDAAKLKGDLEMFLKKIGKRT
jgi:katanin p80 WD40 repeat-containing subunit B1